MRDKIRSRTLAILLAIVMVASCVAMYSSTSTNVKNGISQSRGSESGIISLALPSFIGITGATEAVGGGGAFPVNKAGMSAYINTSQTIDIEKIKTIFTDVEEVGENYIIGTTSISDFGGGIDVHVYADTDGWIVAYLGNDEPASKIMQWGTADVKDPEITTITTTTLEDALHKAGYATAVRIEPNKIKYYHFAFPNANNMMIFIRTRATDGANTHKVEIPQEYMLYEGSYYHYVYGNVHSIYHHWDSKLKVDGMTVSSLRISSVPYGRPDITWGRAFDTYGGWITTGILHTIQISYERTVEGAGEGPSDTGSAGVATVLIYRDA